MNKRLLPSVCLRSSRDPPAQFMREPEISATAPGQEAKRLVCSLAPTVEPRGQIKGIQNWADWL